MAAKLTLLKAYNDAVAKNSNVEDVDQALIQTGRTIADSIDKITADPDASATEKTKALYLAPHLVSILRELLATPAARKAVGLAASDGQKASRLQQIKNSTKKTPGK